MQIINQSTDVLTSLYATVLLQKHPEWLSELVITEAGNLGTKINEQAEASFKQWFTNFGIFLHNEVCKIIAVDLKDQVDSDPYIGAVKLANLINETYSLWKEDLFDKTKADADTGTL